MSAALFDRDGATLFDREIQQFLHDPDIPSASRPVEALPRSWRWIALAGVVALAFIGVLGPGIHFRGAR